MDRLKNYEKLSYDSNIIIYYCLKTKETRVIELTDKTHELTRFLVNNKRQGFDIFRKGIIGKKYFRGNFRTSGFRYL